VDTELQRPQTEYAFCARTSRQEIEVPIDPATAFVSYSRDDWEFVLRLAKDLKAQGAKVWMDKLDIRPGQTWADEIQNAVDSCSKMLIVLSPDSVASRNVQAEVGYAISEGKGIIPIFYRQCNIPFRLLPYQYADFRRDYTIGLQELVSSLDNETRLSRNETAGVPAQLLVDEEERRRRSAIFHAHLEEQHKQASLEQGRLELEQRKQPDASEMVQRELEQRNSAELARVALQRREETEQRLAQRAAEEKARRRKRVRQQIFGQQAIPKEQPRPTLATRGRQKGLERMRAIQAQADRLRQHVANRLADWQQKLRQSLPTLSRFDSKPPRAVLVASGLCITLMLGTVVYETAAISQAKHSRSRVLSSQAQTAVGPGAHQDVASLPGTEQAKTGSTGLKVRQEPPPKPKELATPSSPSDSSSVPETLTRTAAAPLPPKASVSLPTGPVDTPPAGKSTKLAEVYRRARAGDANAMQDLATAFRLGTEVARDDKQAAVWYRKAAEAGNVVAMNKLGDMYKQGDGLKQNYPQALYWYRKAAEAGSPRGMSNLGKMYDNGWGVPTNYEQAADWYRKAASAGDVQGVRSLGVMYEDGLGVPKDLPQAIACYRKAAEAGDAMGMFYLADMYENGKGVRKDFSQAISWYRKAAEAGDCGAMNKMAVMYENGLGVHKDQAQAVFWYRKAAESGDQQAKANLKHLGVIQ
jgi:TPR repeat protein